MKKMGVILAALIMFGTITTLAIIKTTSEAEAMSASIIKATPIKHRIEEKVETPKEVVAYDPWEDDRLLIAKVVQAEAGNQPFVGMVAVASTILNRAELRDMTIAEVVYEKNQYASPWVGTIENDVMDAVDFAKENRDLFPRNMIYFRTNHYHTMKNAEDYTQIGDHFFSLDSRY